MSFSTKKNHLKINFFESRAIIRTTWRHMASPFVHSFLWQKKKKNKVSFKPAVHTDETVSSTPFIRRLREIKSPPHSFGQVTESIPATFQRHDLRLIQIIFLYNKTMPTFSWITFNLQIHLNLIRIQLKIDFDKIKLKCSKNSGKNPLLCSNNF